MVIFAAHFVWAHEHEAGREAEMSIETKGAGASETIKGVGSRSLSLVVGGGVPLSVPETLTGDKKPPVQLAGLRVVGPGYGLNGTELQAFHRQSGTTLALIVRAPENMKVVEVDDSRCSMLEFTDDRGHSLLDGIHWGGFPEISKDGRLALIEVTSKAWPSQKASRLLARGTIHVRVAASERTETIENLELNVGTKVRVRQEVVQVMKVQEEDDGLTLVLQTNRRLANNVKDIRFFEPSGNPVNIWSRGSLTFGNAAQMEFNLETESTPGALNIEIDVWQELEAVDHTFEIHSGVGL
jgi:hypothetical protein